MRPLKSHKYNIRANLDMHDSHIEDFVARYVKDGDVVSIGTSELGERFVKKLALALEHEHIPINKVEFVPTSMRMATIASSLGLPFADINEREIDVAIEFVDQVDEEYNFIKRNSASLVRDKMIAQSAGILVAIADERNLVTRLVGSIPFEVSTFGWKRTLNQLDAFGKARRRESDSVPFKTETGNYIIDVIVDGVFNYEELEYESKNIPGVLETGLFVGFADKIILHGRQIRAMSRTEYK
ncbi:MAG: ribose 5-phosphate isomerase A [Candidatus Diapherotrites archaeon]|uniref:Ribose 5-phosphate isomerase A n=1 Tax=Candidatus Iainarchaeum sp. TaxID=3101447 RepID=A0A8T3YQ57_9ARCH|nr:ribose 5-phosphate isomerase A [Candidatus Diapherotrites archaeon]